MTILSAGGKPLAPTNQIKRLLLGTPAGDFTVTRTAHAFMAAKDCCTANGITVGSGPSIGTYVERNQNFLIAAALETHCDAIMLIDSDMDFPQDIVMRLLKRNKPIVGCAYRSRQPPHDIMARYPDGTPVFEHHTGFREMEYVPSGMMLIRRSVLVALGYPWFFNTYGDRQEDFVGNDVNFCQKAKAAGFPPWCDLDASSEIGHFGLNPIRWQR